MKRILILAGIALNIALGSYLATQPERATFADAEGDKDLLACFSCPWPDLDPDPPDES